MNAQIASDTTTPPASAGPLLRTLVLCDLVDSTALVERLGDQRAAALIRRHDRLARDLLQRHGGREIDKTDGFLVLFERPIQGVAFALDYQQELRRLGSEEEVTLRARVGIHVGDVMVWDNTAADVAKGAKPVEVEGLVKPVAARLASLALPGQILASGVAASLAQRAHGELGAREATARWINHGRYRFKGVPEPLPVYEVGEAGLAPLEAPPWSGKAHREVPWWRRPATVAVEVVLLLAALAGVAWWALRPPPAIAFAERDWVVVGSLRNLTPEKRFDDALDAAFRIGLQQSRHVNVLSELQVREALKRMRRDPEAPLIDRQVASELALREGARAVILPSVVEVGGKVRITAEVVDPSTQATVYSESADGEGAPSTLDSLARVSDRVRERLGESLATVAKSSQPLPQVTTTSLDALRAYALGARLLLDARFKEALALFDQALQLDPQFAMARLGRARVFINSDDRAAALAELDRIMPLRDRLPTREALYFDALLATFRTPAEMLEKWKLFANLYPDAYFAHSNYGLMAWNFANAFDAAAEQTRLALDPHNPSVGLAHYQLGLLEIGRDDFGAAAREFAAAQQAGAPRGDAQAIVLAAQRQFEPAWQIVGAVPDQGIASDDMKRAILRLTLALDAGEFTRLDTRIEAMQALSGNSPGMLARLARGVQVSVGALRAPTEFRAPLQTFVATELAALRREGDPDRDFSAFASMFGAYLLAGPDETAVVEQVIKQSAEPIERLRIPVLEKMHALLKARLALARRDPAQALRLAQALREPDELYLTHEVLLDAYWASAQWDDALAEANWLASHRGRAYAEYGGHYLQRPYDVALSTVALRRAAECAARLQRADAVREHLAAFDRAWPARTLPEALRQRRDALVQASTAEVGAPTRR